MTTVAPSSTTDIELSLLRVAVGYRVFAAGWLAVLAVITLAGGQSRLDRPTVVVIVFAVAVGWTGLTVYLGLRAKDALRSIPFLCADVAVAVLTLLSADLAGTEGFSGGYPLAVVFLAIYARGTWAGMSAATALTAAATYRVVQQDSGDLTATTGTIIVYLFSGAAAAWAVSVIRDNDRRARSMEEALAVERTERARAEERTELAAHLHDSVLQTLAMIQRRSTDPAEVTTLARSQERELRQWLYGEQGDKVSGGFRDALEAMGADVEALTAVPVDVVAVGTATYDEDMGAILSAAKEAVVNAAKHSGAASVDVYGEVDAHRMAIFVRDRGSGFDPAAVPADRKGIRESIVARIVKRGGRAEIVSSPGHGTEVRLSMDRGAKGG